MVYINASPGIGTVLDNVEQAGGKIIGAKTEIPAGFITVIIDSEETSGASCGKVNSKYPEFLKVNCP